MTPQSHAQQMLVSLYRKVLRTMNRDERLRYWAGSMEPLPPRVLFNIAPVLLGANSFSSIGEDAFTNSGTLIASLVAGKVTDADAGSLSGIAVTGVDSSHGAWQYTLDGGTNWFSIAGASTANALMLPADAAARVRFIPQANWNGTIGNGLTFRAWDQSSHSAGGTADITSVPGPESVLDQFSAVLYANNDGTTNWTSPWTETDSSGGGPASGAFSISGGRFAASALNGGDSIERSIDLSGATDATLTFDYDNQLASGDTIVLTVSGNGQSGVVASFSASAGAGSISFDISPYMASDTRLTLMVQNSSSGGVLYLDDVQVAFRSNTTAFSYESASADITIDPVNDAPVNTVPSAQTTQEDTALVLSSANGNAVTVSDADALGSPMQLTLSASAGVITLATSAGLTFLSGDGITDGSMTFTGSATAINAALDGMTYMPPADGNGAFTLTITSDDQGYTGSGGALSDTDSVAIVVTAVNDAPVNALPPSQAVVGGSILNLGGSTGTALSVSDVDAGSNVLQVTLSATAGTLTLASTSGLSFTSGDGNSDSSMTFTGTIASINNALDGMSYNPPFLLLGNAYIDITTNDLGSTGTGGAQSDSDTLTVGVSPANQPPVNTAPGAQTVIEDGNLIFSASNGNRISIDDPDAGAGAMEVTLTATNGKISLNGTAGLTFISGDGNSDISMKFTGTIANINNALNGLVFSANPNFFGSASLQIITNDQGNSGGGGAKSDSSSVSITVTSVNDAPVNTVPGAQAIAEDATIVFSIANGTAVAIEDVDSGNSQVQVSLTATNGALTLSQLTGLSFTTGDGTADGSMVFTGKVANINAALAGMTFTPTANFNGSASVQIATDDLGHTGSGGALTDSDTINISISAVNDAPVNSLPASQTISEDQAISLSTANGNAIVVSDVDAGSAVMSITLTTTGGRIRLPNRSGLTFTTGNGLNDTLTTFLGTLSDINAALDGLIFHPLGNFSGTAFVTVTASDQGNAGAGGTLSTTSSLTINVLPVNDPPQIDAPSSASGLPNTPMSFSTSNGNAIIVSDPDVGSGVEKVTLASTHGALTLSTTTGLSFQSGSGAADSMMVFTGVLADINAALNGLVFMPTTGYRGLAAIQINVDDQGYTGAGGAQTASATVNLNVNAPNQPPTINVPSAQTVDEDTALTFWSLFGNAITVADSDAGAGDLLVTLTASHGKLTLGGTTGLNFVTGDGYDDATMTFTGTLVAINTAIDGLAFVPSPDFNGTTSISISVNDQGNTGTGGAKSASASVNVSVTARNDPPYIQDPGDQTINEDSSIIFSGAKRITITDVDAGSGTLVCALTTPKGRLTLSRTTGLSFTTGDGISDATMSFSGTLAAINAALDGLIFVPTPDYTGFTALQIYVQDNGNSGLGGPATASRATSIQMLPINDAPVNQVPAFAGMQEDMSLVLSGANKIVVTDVDAGSATIRVSLWANHGRLTLNGMTGLTFIAGDGTDDVSLTIDGTLSAINAALNGLTFDPDLNFHGTGQVRILTEDLGNSGAGSQLSDDDTLSIAVGSIDDVPTSIGLDDIKVDEDSPTTVFDLTTRFSDVDDASNTLDYTIVNNTNTALFASAVIDPATHELKLSYAKDANGVAHLIIRATDSSGLSVDVPLTVQVDPVNDAPVVAINTGIVVSSGSAVTITSQALHVDDVDNTPSELTYTLIRIPTGGALALNGAVLKLGNTFTQLDIDAGRLQYTTDGGSGNDGFEFTAADKIGATTAKTAFVIDRQTGGSSTPLPPPPAPAPTPGKVPQPDPSTDDHKPDDHKSDAIAQVPLPPFSHTISRPPSSNGSGGGTGDEATAAPAPADSAAPAPASEQKADGPHASANAPAPAETAPEAPPAPPPAAPTVEAGAGQIGSAAAAAPRVAVGAPAAPRPVPAPAPAPAAPPQLTPAQSAQQVQFVTEAGTLWKELDQFHKEMTQETITLHLVAGTASFVTFSISIVYILWTIRAGYMVASLLSTMPAWRVIDPLPILDHFEDETERRRRRALEDGESLESLVDRPMIERADRPIGEAS